MKGASTRFAGLLAASLVAAALIAIAGCTASTPTVERVLSVTPAQETAEASATNTPISTPSAVASPVAESTTPPSSAEVFVEARVVAVIDGDTIRVTLGNEVHSVRYIGIDAPEGDSPDERLKQLAAEATAKNSELVAGKTVRLERDVSETDDFGRLLRYVWVGDLMVNSELVRQGYARAVTYKPDVRHQAVFTELERQAQAARLGLWSTTEPIAKNNANLRSGPGTSYKKVGSVEAGESLEVVAQNQAGDWFQLASGAWILDQLVSNAPGGLPVADVTRAQEVALATQTLETGIGATRVEIVGMLRNGTKGQTEPDEYVEIQNLGSQPQDLTGWRLESERRPNDFEQIFYFPKGFVIEPGQKCRIYTNEDHPESCGFNFRHGQTAIWNNSEPDAALLFDNADNLVSRRQ